MLLHYCREQGWEVVSIFEDDGYTGLNMNRPDFQKMLEAIERKEINLVITKDLSRLGRNYLETGDLIERYFPRKGVHYIALNDDVDTMGDVNDITPFKNLLNEMYSVSKKVHSAYLARSGRFPGALPRPVTGKTRRITDSWSLTKKRRGSCGASTSLPGTVTARTPSAGGWRTRKFPVPRGGIGSAGCAAG